MTILSEFKNMLEDPEEDVRVDTLIKTPTDRAVYEKWIQIFNTITPFSIPQGVSIIDSSYKMSKRDCIVLLAYIKFFEQKLSKMKGENSEMEKLFKEMNNMTEEMQGPEVEGKGDNSDGMFG